MSIDQTVIDITVSLSTPVVSAAGFSTPLIAGTATFGERVKSYVASDDYAAAVDLTADIIAMLTSAFSQDLQVTTVKVGRVDVNVAQKNNLAIGSSVDNEVFGVTINGNSYTYTASSDLPADIVDALILLIDAGEADITCTDNGDDFDITSDTAGNPFTIVDDPLVTGTQTLTVVTPNTNIATELALIQADDPDWWVCCLESRDEVDIDRANAWVAALSVPKIIVTQTSDSDVPTTATDDVASEIIALDLDERIALVWDADDAKKLAIGWSAFTLEADPDAKTTTWAFKTISGAASTPPTTTQKVSLEAKNVNWYDTLGGDGAMWPGKMLDGTFIDNRLSADWFAVRLTERFIAMLMDYSNRNSKVPMTTQGLGIVESVPWSLIEDGVAVDHFVDGTGDVDMPELVDILAADRANRLVRFSASAQLAGAIHKIVANVNLYV